MAIPDAGRTSPRRQRAEKARGIRRGNRFRAGIEGQIHVLGRDFGLERSRDLGERGMGRWVGWGILAHNLSKIAEAGAARGSGGSPWRSRADPTVVE